MKIFITIKGDITVGIQDHEIIIDDKIPIPSMFEDKEYREEARGRMRDFFSNEYDGAAYVFFEDECPACLKLLNGKVCKTKCCPNNIEV